MTETETTLWMHGSGELCIYPNPKSFVSTNTVQIVDKRSATIANQDYYVGCEDVIPIEATHAILPSFDNGNEDRQLQNYTELLTEIMNSSRFEDHGYDILAHTVRVECHQFYQRPAKVSGEIKKVLLFSATPEPTLSQALQQGPAYLVERRRTKALAPLEAALNESNVQQDSNGKIRPDIRKAMLLGKINADETRSTECEGEESSQITIDDDLHPLPSDGRALRSSCCYREP